MNRLRGHRLLRQTIVRSPSTLLRKHRVLRQHNSPGRRRRRSLRRNRRGTRNRRSDASVSDWTCRAVKTVIDKLAVTNPLDTLALSSTENISRSFKRKHCRRLPARFGSSDSRPDQLQPFTNKAGSVSCEAERTFRPQNSSRDSLD